MQRVQLSIVIFGLTLALSTQAAPPPKKVSQAVHAAKAQAKPVLSPLRSPPAFALAHNLDELSASQIKAIVDRFNQQNAGNLQLVRLEKGMAPAGLNLINRFEMGDLLRQGKLFVPLHRMMAQAGESLNVGTLSVNLRAGVSDRQGKLLALPLLYSTPVMFYNKDAFKKAKLDPEKPPETWFEMQGMLDQLQDAGYECPYASSWPVWVHIDNVSALSGAPAVNAKGQLVFNGLPQVKHIAMMQTWTEANYFKHFGRRDEASKHFADGQCAVLTSDSREASVFRASASLDFGMAPLPHHEDIYGGRQHTLADGYTLWVGARRSTAEYRQLAKFISYLLTPEQQLLLARQHGGIPLTTAAREASRSQTLKPLVEGMQETVEFSLKGKGGDPARRVADVDQVRIIADEELEAVWANKKPTKEALDTAVRRGNAVLSAKPELRRAHPF